MKSITSETPLKDKIVIVGQKEIEKQEKLVGMIIPQKGHTLFEINLKEKTIEPAEFEDSIAPFKKEKKISQGIGIAAFKDGRKKVMIDKPKINHKKLIRKPNCIYISKLNKENVLKELVKRGIVKMVRK